MFKELILSLYQKGHSVRYITQCVYKKANEGYFHDYYSNKIINNDKYHKLAFCRKLVESTVLEYISNPQIA